MDLGGWLRGLGLEQYEAAFRENEIDDTVLPEVDGGRSKRLGRYHRRAASRLALTASSRSTPNSRKQGSPFRTDSKKRNGKKAARHYLVDDAREKFRSFYGRYPERWS
jgi:hypothetical protein